jgi:hypothetical protein
MFSGGGGGGGGGSWKFARIFMANCNEITW